VSARRDKLQGPSSFDRPIWVRVGPLYFHAHILAAAVQKKKGGVNYISDKTHGRAKDFPTVSGLNESHARLTPCVGLWAHGLKGMGS
jgi:hypothetical protein